MQSVPHRSRLCRFVVSYVYYGIAMNISDLGGNIFVNFVISAAAEFPAYFLSTVIAHFCGRVVPLSATFFLSGLCLLLVAAVPAREFQTPVNLCTTFL